MICLSNSPDSHEINYPIEVSEELNGGLEKPRFPVRRQLLTAVGALGLLALLSSTLSLYRITQVNQTLRTTNRVTVPLNKTLNQVRADTELLIRELDRRLGVAHWVDPHWRPQPVPVWIRDVLIAGIEKVYQLTLQESDWSHSKSRAWWRRWVDTARTRFDFLQTQTGALLARLKEEGPHANPMEQVPGWIQATEAWNSHVLEGFEESRRLVNESFTGAENQVSDLRIGLQGMLVAVLVLSLLLLWLGERALRPLGDLARLAREITRRGIRKEDKGVLSSVPILREDEVGLLAREFHNMATALLEREKTLENQNSRNLELQRQLQLSEHLAAIGRMSAQVAHEIRNPLHSIGLETEMALEINHKRMAALLDDGSGIQLKQSLSSIQEGVDRLEKITDNYLQLSRFSERPPEEFDLVETLQEVLAVFGPSCEASKIKVDWEQKNPSPSAVPMRATVCGNRNRMEQALSNLMHNAIQALNLSNEQDRKIFWKIHFLESGRILLVIQDNGPGLPEEVKQKIFTPFLTTRAQGTGLGLPLVKKVIEEHGGEIKWIDGQELSGASFEICLPLVDSICEQEKKNGQNTLSR